MVRVQHRARCGEVEVVVGADVPRQVEHPVQVGADPAVLGALLTGALQPVDLVLHLGRHLLRHAGVGEPLAIGGDHVVPSLAQLLLDGLELLAQDELALVLLHPLGHLGADAVLEIGLAERLLRPRNDEGQPLLDIERLQDLQLLGQAEVGGVPGKIGQVSGRSGFAEELDGSAGAPDLQQALDQRAIFARQFDHCLGGVLVVRSGIDLHPERAAHVRLPRAEAGAVLPGEDRDLGAGGQLSRLLHARDSADASELALDAGDQEDEAVALVGRLDRGTLGLPLDRDGHGHVRQDDDLVKRKDRKKLGAVLGHGDICTRSQRSHTSRLRIAAGGWPASLPPPGSERLSIRNQDGRPPDPTRPDQLQGPIRLGQGEHLGQDVDPRLTRQRHEVGAILPREVGHGTERALPPEQRVGEPGDVAHVNAGADDGAPGPHRREREGHQLAGWSEDDGGVERLGSGAGALPRPRRPHAAGKLLAGEISSPREGVHRGPTVAGHLRDQVCGAAEAVQAQPRCLARHAKRSEADEAAAEERRRLDIPVGAGQAQAEAGVGQDELGETAVDVAAGEPGGGAEVLAPRGTHLAASAGRGQPRHAHPLSHLQGGIRPR